MMSCERCEAGSAPEVRHGMRGHAHEGEQGERHFLACWQTPAPPEISLACPYTADPRAFGLCYLATPYTKYPGGIEIAFEHAAALAGRLLVAGIKIYSPIAHCHPLAKFAGIDPLNHAVWIPFHDAQVHAAGCLVVAQLPTWSSSYGVKHEVGFFEALQKPVVYLDPSSMRIAREPHRGLT